eukprot:8495766-Pyramimonas_sp.AAC.2
MAGSGAQAAKAVVAAFQPLRGKPNCAYDLLVEAKQFFAVLKIACFDRTSFLRGFYNCGWHAVFEVVRNLPNFGVGSKIKRKTWEGDNCYWTVTKIHPDKVTCSPPKTPLKH